MASSLPEPVRRFLTAALPIEAEMKDILQDAAEEAERLIPKLIEKNTTGGKVRASQISLVLREIRAQQAAMWGDLTPVLRRGLADAAVAGASADEFFDGWLRSLGADVDTMKESLAATARAGWSSVRAKAANGIPLSTQVYRTQALANGFVDRTVKRGLLLGRTAKEIAKDVRGLINPNVAGGVSYAAMRLARTELNNAFHTASIARHVEEPWTLYMGWHLSGSHPEKDVCDELAEHNEGHGDGVYPKGKTPMKPHPHCLCYVTPEVVDEDAFIEGFLRGDYDDYLEEKEAVLPEPAKKEASSATETDIRKSKDYLKAVNAPDAFAYTTGVSSDKVMDAIVKEKGLGSLPSLLPQEEFESYLASNGQPLMFRGVRSAVHDQNFLTGDYYAGIGDQGNGIYVHYQPKGYDAHEEARKNYLGEDVNDPDNADSELPAFALKAIAREEQRLKDSFIDNTKLYAGGSGVVRRMTIKKGVEILDLQKDVYPRMEKYHQELTEEINAATGDAKKQLQIWQRAMKDPGRWAAAHGIDAYYGTTEGEILIVNRGVMIVEDVKQ